MKAIFLILLILLSPFLKAEIEVTEVKGKVLFDQKPIKVGQILNLKGKITTAKGSLCRLSLNEGSSQVIVGPNSTYFLERPGTKKEASLATLLKGRLRYFSNGKAKGLAPEIKTKQAAMGIRGTDFLLIATALLGETEIVMFEGKVRMTNLSATNDRLDVKAGQWGGLGGRFGSKFQKPIDLPKNVLSVFDRKIRK